LFPTTCAEVPKLTMIAGAGYFPSGNSQCESFLSQSNNSRRKWQS
jgi:hypothetical protein